MSGPPNLSNWHVRPAAESDLDALLAIETASFETPWSRSSLRSTLKQAQTHVYLATAAEGPIAYANFQSLLDECELLRLAVVPPYRRQKIGQHMLEQGLEALYRKGCRLCHLEVRDDNRGARRLYEATGFEIGGRRRGYYRQGDTPVDAVLYRLSMESWPPPGVEND